MTQRQLRTRSGARRRTLGIQHLENRGMLAGDVAVTLSGTTLNIFGDGASNEIEIDVVLGNLTVTGNGGTSVTGLTSTPVAGITKIAINMGNGDDVVDFLAGVSLPGVDIVASLGASPAGDTFTAPDLTAQNLTISALGGADVVDIDAYDGKNLSVKVDGSSAAGQSVALGGLTLTGTLNVVAGAAGDAFGSDVTIDDATATATTVTAAAGSSSVAIDDLTATSLYVKAAGASADLDLGGVTANTINGALTVTTGASSTVTIGAAAVANVVTGLTTVTAGGSANIDVLDVEFNGNVLIKVANGATNSVSLNEIDIDGRLTISLGNSSTLGSVELLDTDALLDVTGPVSIVAGNGASDMTLGGALNDIALGGTTQIVVGNGDSDIDLWNLVVSNGIAAGVSNLVVTARNGDADITVDTVQVEGKADLRAGNATTFSAVNIDDVTIGISLTVTLGTAVGVNDVDIDTVTIGQDLNVTSGGGVGGSAIDIIAADVARNLFVTTKAGNDVINIDGTNVLGTTTINTGNDNDDVTLGATTLSSFTKKVTIVLGTGNDDLVIGGFVDDTVGAFLPGSYLIAFDGGLAGTDTITSALGSFTPSDPLLNSKITNFETETP